MSHHIAVEILHVNAQDAGDNRVISFRSSIAHFDRYPATADGLMMAVISCSHHIRQTLSAAELRISLMSDMTDGVDLVSGADLLKLLSLVGKNELSDVYSICSELIEQCKGAVPEITSPVIQRPVPGGGFIRTAH